MKNLDGKRWFIHIYRTAVAKPPLFIFNKLAYKKRHCIGFAIRVGDHKALSFGRRCKHTCTEVCYNG